MTPSPFAYGRRPRTADRSRRRRTTGIAACTVMGLVLGVMVGDCIDVTGDARPLGDIDGSTIDVLVPDDSRFQHNLMFGMANAPNNYELSSNQSLAFDEQNHPTLASTWYQIGDPDSWTGIVTIDDGQQTPEVEALTDATHPDATDNCTIEVTEPQIVSCDYAPLYADPDYEPPPRQQERTTILVRHIKLDGGTPVVLWGPKSPGIVELLSSTFTPMPVGEAATRWPPHN